MAGVNDNLIPPVKGEVRNPKGKPKGTLHISTHIQRMMDDPDFEATILDPKKGIAPYKGAPVRAVLQVVLTKAINGDLKAAEVLMKYGYAQKVEQENSGTIEIVTRKHMGG